MQRARNWHCGMRSAGGAAGFCRLTSIPHAAGVGHQWFKLGPVASRYLVDSRYRDSMYRRSLKSMARMDLSSTTRACESPRTTSRAIANDRWLSASVADAIAIDKKCAYCADVGLAEPSAIFAPTEASARSNCARRPGIRREIIGDRDFATSTVSCCDRRQTRSCV